MPATWARKNVRRESSCCAGCSCPTSERSEYAHLETMLLDSAIHDSHSPVLILNCHDTAPNAIVHQEHVSKSLEMVYEQLEHNHASTGRHPRPAPWCSIKAGKNMMGMG